MKLSDRSGYILDKTGRDSIAMAIVAMVCVIFYEGLRWGANWCLGQIGIQKNNFFWEPFIVVCVFTVVYSIYKWLDNGDDYDRWLNRKRMAEEHEANCRLAEDRLRESTVAISTNLEQRLQTEIANEADWKTRSPTLH